ncbi:37S ribosomal protein S24, mitochondrial [Friedmanniomyces endolithicus]|uniref:37S ribosomal protein S24, mitochondrial n=1 Tax=Friedmanniomyces endolithicus TaxID=329885 RepID=A0AAN6QU16_9PEZI|nr:37S ribosomal protein S24, mitochondrial [Friedmanniomyces endolithicus]KAK0778812.1 37S ribosomal protein S24, mitochondrial [Friedmanniomyces endolithicus]KAK0804909.1 37S ribosomal protein S24, mitochondrial [Friedmanniomyces endolithicus]KAK0853558.1 37S ribosomal protein S24, mitochondrial [Friedmanniomyces endolithicus]KAK0861154.1 37S ribosomal protein S24, mitochondrial [Friedmanniomyces endolithicus]
MAAPFKRICCQATRHTTHRSPCQPYRTFSTTTPSNQADHLTTTPSPSNPFLTTLPPSATNDNNPSSSSSPDPAYEDDDISTLGLSELHAHRELRDLLRTAAWEMPLLTSLHKPFVPPSQLKTPSPLRWRYTTYMGEAHPAASKVVLTFDPHEIPGLTGAQREKLLKLVGTRYDFSKRRVKMSCEIFETQAQNKRYLGDVVGKLIKEAKDTDADGFEDVPLDTRHVRVRPKLGFPAAWKLTEERMAGLESARRVALLEEGRRVEEDRVVSGEAAIEEARRTRLLREPEQPVMVEARQTVARGKKEMKQRAGRR